MAVVTSINVAVGAPVHITVTDESGNPIPQSNITWDYPTNIIGFGVGTDSTGFIFEISQNVASSGIVTKATYRGPGSPTPVVGPELSVNFINTVTALQYTSP